MANFDMQKHKFGDKMSAKRPKAGSSMAGRGADISTFGGTYTRFINSKK